ncbi:MAG: DNA repair protein RadC [Candidatus Paceibacterota bacterium]
MKIKDLPKVDRPREKLIKYGPDKLNNSELLAILLGTGTKGTNVVELANKILKKFSGDYLAKAQFKELKNTFGLGSAKACEIVACFELGRRLLKGKKSVLILSPQEVWHELRDIRNNKKDHFVVFYLDTRNQEIKRKIISIGTLNANLVHPREVFEPAVKYSAAQIIVAHNHPSGDTDPSQEDMDITKRLVETGKILDIEVLDHVIVSKTGYFSFKEKKLI